MRELRPAGAVQLRRHGLFHARQAEKIRQSFPRQHDVSGGVPVDAQAHHRAQQVPVADLGVSGVPFHVQTVYREISGFPVLRKGRHRPLRLGIAPEQGAIYPRFPGASPGEIRLHRVQKPGVQGLSRPGTSPGQILNSLFSGYHISK